ncbi:hypothetical protein BsWGS_00378 [Bradybaena similaris]
MWHLIDGSLLCLLLVGALCGAQELLTNPSFETGVNGWSGDGFTLQTDSSTFHEGAFSALCTGRSQTWQGPAQAITLTPGHRYEFSAYIQIIDDSPGRAAQPVYVRITSSFSNGTKTVLELATRLRVRPNDAWVHLGGTFLYPNNPYTGAILSVEGPAAGVSYYFDDTSLVEIPEYTTWEADANKLIESHRKNNIRLTINVPSNLAASDFVVHVDHTRHLFGFGTAARSDYVVNTSYKQYLDVLYSLFNTATVSDYQWFRDQGTQTNPDFSRAAAATDELIRNGLKVRGESLFAAVQGAEPGWVSGLNSQALQDAVTARINYLTGITKGKISQWVVNNQLLHGSFYEDRTGNPTFTQDIFKAVGAADPSPALILNDFDVVAGGSHNLAYVDQINAFKNANVGLRGVGIQSRFADSVKPDITLVKARLDNLAATGVPLWITQLTVGADNDQDKADWYENVLRLYFSHPSVEGISLLGFWDHEVNPNSALVHGYTYTLGEAGKRYQRLIKQDWSTHVIQSLSASSSFTVRGFQGDYALAVYYKGKPVQRTAFSLGKSDIAVIVDVTGTTEIQLPPVVDPFAPQDLEFATSSLNLQTLGHATSTSQSQQLGCVSRRSPVSDVGDEKTATVSCNAGEILTGCSSFSTNNNWQRDGEQVSFSNGKPVCTAFNGFYSSAGVQAEARCCSLKSLQCRYRTAGPSGTGERDEIIIPCSDNEYPLGCGTWSFEAESAGTIFTSSFCVGQNDDPVIGIYGYAACCQATPSLHCVTMYSDDSGQNVGDRAVLTCPAEYGFTLTGCNVHAPNGRGAGAFIEVINGVDSCVAINGFQRYGTERGVQSVAACCRVIV